MDSRSGAAWPCRPPPASTHWTWATCPMAHTPHRCVPPTTPATSRTCRSDASPWTTRRPRWLSRAWLKTASIPAPPAPLSRSAIPIWPAAPRSEEHTSELQSPCNLVCRLLLEKKNCDTGAETKCMSTIRHSIGHLHVPECLVLGQFATNRPTHRRRFPFSRLHVV